VKDASSPGVVASARKKCSYFLPHPALRPDRELLGSPPRPHSHKHESWVSPVNPSYPETPGRKWPSLGMASVPPFMSCCLVLSCLVWCCLVLSCPTSPRMSAYDGEVGPALQAAFCEHVAATLQKCVYKAIAKLYRRLSFSKLGSIKLYHNF
jgi:hypothetical protein